MFWSAQQDVTESIDWQTHEVFELLYCHSGSGRVLVGEHEIELHPNRMVLILPGTRHMVAIDPGRPAELKFVCVTPQDTARYLSPVQVALLESLRGLGCTSSDSSSEMPLLGELARLIPNGSVSGDHRELLVVWGVIGLLLAAHAYPLSSEAVRAEPRHGGKIHQICAWLDDHLEEESNLDEIAAHFGMSRSLLTRSFRSHTGSSIVEYVNARRLEKAAVLLASSGSRSITEAAFESGFANLSNFHRRFKAAYGFTPAEFRRNFASDAEAARLLQPAG